MKPGNSLSRAIDNYTYFGDATTRYQAYSYSILGIPSSEESTLKEFNSFGVYRQHKMTYRACGGFLKSLLRRLGGFANPIFKHLEESSYETR